ncbi:hypothetical protein HHK36_001261 [Tetracentron sinense]|uniref:RNase H type-1 domain-containing protein n=1 Tax=Tetracentron sinense TaxID=13715 RepID=A0A834ZTD5_TETSI|nr:hypothetical protein HHK36_001261 [Tetracentron sinense]
MVARDHRGIILRSKSKALAGGFACIAEALREGVWMTISNHWPKIIVESDSKELVNYLNGDAPLAQGITYPIMEDVRVLRRQCEDFLFSFVYQEANTMAQRAINVNLHRPIDVLGVYELGLDKGMVCSRNNLPSWISSEASRVDFDENASSMAETMFTEGREAFPPQQNLPNTISDFNLGFAERSFSAAGAAFLSAILVNPLDVVKTRLQAQAAGVPYSPPEHHVRYRMASLGPNMMFTDLRCSPSCARGGILGTEPFCPPDCFQYKGTLDVFYKIIRQRFNGREFVQEGFARLWRGTSASLALAVPTVGIYLPCYDIFRNWMEEFTTQNAPNLTPYVPLVAGSVARSLACITCYPIELAKTRMQAFKEFRIGVKPPGVWKILLGILSPIKGTNNLQYLQSYRILWTGVGAQLARDVPFSAICWSTLEPTRRRILGLAGENANAASILWANFSAGFVAGSLAAAATCPLDVAKTRRQIEKDPARALRMTTRQTLMEVWRAYLDTCTLPLTLRVVDLAALLDFIQDGGMKGLFTGIGPRVGRAGPSVGIVVSFYEVVKYVLHQRHTTS